MRWTQPLGICDVVSTVIVASPLGWIVWKMLRERWAGQFRWTIECAMFSVECRNWKGKSKRLWPNWRRTIVIAILVRTVVLALISTTDLCANVQMLGLGQHVQMMLMNVPFLLALIWDVKMGRAALMRPAAIGMSVLECVSKSSDPPIFQSLLFSIVW